MGQRPGHKNYMNYSELLFLIKEGELLDERLTLFQLTDIFTRTNVLGEALGDSDPSQLCFQEFGLLLARMANVKFPPEERDGEPFETTWHNFLQLIFVPRFRKLLKAKKQGAGRQTTDGYHF
jgi:hypothetical protein